MNKNAGNELLVLLEIKAGRIEIYLRSKSFAYATTIYLAEKKIHL